MATLILICGLPGSGKTTLAKQLERDRRALRRSPDEWMAPLLGESLDQAALDSHREPVKFVQWSIAARALGVNVVLDWGFWSRRERDTFRAQAEELGARAELHFLEASLAELWPRLDRRNRELLPGTLAVTKDDLERWTSCFEPPSAGELEEWR